MSSVPTQFPGVTALTKANLYFDARVVSHTLLFADGSKKTLGLIYPGTYHFGTAVPERMEIVSGLCGVTLDGQNEALSYGPGTMFEVPGQSGFTITVASGVCEYICTFLSA